MYKFFSSKSIYDYQSSDCFFLHLQVVLGTPPKFTKQTKISFCIVKTILPLHPNSSKPSPSTSVIACASSKDPSFNFVGHFIPKSSISTIFYNHLKYASFIVRFVVYLREFREICNLGVDFFQTMCCETIPIPQLTYESVTKLWNWWFHNTLGGDQMY